MRNFFKRKRFVSLPFFVLLLLTYCERESQSVKDSYTKQEYRIKVRDGKKLFTAVYTPKDLTKDYPIMLIRTPYSVRPYGTNKFPERLGPSAYLENEQYIFAYQDVRGRFMSEGDYVNMRPYIPGKTDSLQIDESTDTYDTIDWLIKNVPHNNGKVGIWGISYPGFYAAMSTIDAHPALKAVSPQAPIADWFIGDDMHHNGAFTLSLTFNFFSVFGQVRDSLTQSYPSRIYYPSPDAYSFFLDLGPISNANEKYFKYKIPFWNEITTNGIYNEFWQSRNTLPHFNNVTPAVMTVGGWFDGEDLYGALHTYQSIESKNENNFNIMVMGPWRHGGWARTKGDSFGILNFNSSTSDFYQKNIELPFFNYYLKDKGSLDFPEVFIFATGSNKWLTLNQWPPAEAQIENLYFYPESKLDFQKPGFSGNKFFDEYISDPQNPVPYSAVFHDTKALYNRKYMTEDQRFAFSRPDVLKFESDSLSEDITITGPVKVVLYVSTSGTDSDWIVKLIDVYPDIEPNPDENPENYEYGGYQMMVRGEIMRGKFRDNYKFPKPFVPNQITKVEFTLQDICHTFLARHKIMVQVQSSWFPIFDRNPQTFCDIYNAGENDFIKATQRLYFSKEYPSHLEFLIYDLTGK